MKINASSKLLITSLAIVFLSILSGLVVNLLSSDTNFGQWLKDNNIGTGKLIIGVVLSGLALLGFTYLQIRYTQQSEQTNGKENLAGNIEPVVKEYYDKLKERYLIRYKSKLDGRFEITLEVSENWDGENTKQFTGEYEGKGQISEAFEYIRSAFEKQGRLLIVGSPGVGKTVLLLKLALELLEKANIEKKEAFPVIFNLASWSAEYKNFNDWLISVLNSGEGLSKNFAGKLLQEERIIFLLDGLDELARNENEETAAEIRAECLQSLNEYLDRGKKAVICCRANEFELIQTLTGKDAPVSAKVKVNDLNEAEVLNTLMKVEEDKTNKTAAANLLKILKKDENNTFLKVLRSPFYFTTALEIFDKQIFDEDFPKTKSGLENYLRKKFIKKKLNITPNLNKFNKEKTQKWLSFLADLMNKKNLVAFELADLQTDDLIGRKKFGLLGGLLSCIFGILIGVLIGSIIFTPLFGLSEGLTLGLYYGYTIGLVSAMVFSLVSSSKKKQPEKMGSLVSYELLNWYFWKDVLVSGLATSLVFSITNILFLIFFGELADGVLAFIIGSLTVGLFFGLGGGVIGGLIGNYGKIRTEDIVKLDFSKLFYLDFWKNIFVKGFVVGAVNGLLIGIIGGFIVGFFSSLFKALFDGVINNLFIDLITGVGAGVFIGLIFGFIGGWITGLLGGIFGIFLIGFENLKNVKSFCYLENPYQRIIGGFHINIYFISLLFFIFVIGSSLLFNYIQNRFLLGSLFFLISVFLFLAITKLQSIPLFLHSVLRLCLYYENNISLKYVTFLDYAAEARILEKDGGHWRFRHQNLQDYFANLDEQAKSPMSSQKVG